MHIGVNHGHRGRDAGAAGIPREWNSEHLILVFVKISMGGKKQEIDSWISGGMDGSARLRHPMRKKLWLGCVGRGQWTVDSGQYIQWTVHTRFRDRHPPPAKRHQKQSADQTQTHKPTKSRTVEFRIWSQRRFEFIVCMRAFPVILACLSNHSHSHSAPPPQFSPPIQPPHSAPFNAPPPSAFTLGGTLRCYSGLECYGPLISSYIGRFGGHTPAGRIIQKYRNTESPTKVGWGTLRLIALKFHEINLGAGVM